MISELKNLVEGKCVEAQVELVLCDMIFRSCLGETRKKFEGLIKSHIVVRQL